jgi:hypothetical protein
VFDTSVEEDREKSAESPFAATGTQGGWHAMLKAYSMKFVKFWGGRQVSQSSSST